MNSSYFKAFLLLISLSTTDVSGCSCFRRFEANIEDLWDYDLIFKGKVLSVESVKSDPSLPQQKALFEIEKLVLGNIQTDTVSIYTNAGCCACGLGFVKGVTWLIYANGFRNFNASTCSNSTSQRNESDLKEINKIIYFMDSIQNGSYKVFQKGQYQSSSYDIVGQIVDGKPDGKWFMISFADTLCRLNFLNGVQMGKQIDKRTGWIIEKEIYFQDGSKMATMFYHDKSKTMRTVLSYKDGVLHGLYELRFGNNWDTGQYVEGQKEGEWLSYHKGKLVAREKYSSNKLMSTIEYDEEGDIIIK
jgi:antitoxin component YwqK of YwqJK toxin-antitoxin module